MDNKRIPTLEMLNELLKRSNHTLDSNALKYIRGLINLEFSALREDVINKEEREYLSKISLYRKAVIYNIYNRALELLEKEKRDFELTIFNNKDNYAGILATCNSSDNNPIKVYNYIFPEETQKITINEYKEDLCRRDEEISRLLSLLERLKKTREININTLGKEQGTKINIPIGKLINELESRHQRLSERTFMEEEDRERATIQNHFSRLFEKEYNINRKKDYKENTKTKYRAEPRNNMFKVLEIPYPTLTLKKEVKYY